MRSFNDTELTEITSQLQTIFGSNTKILSFKTLRQRQNDGKAPHTTGYLTSRQLSYVLSGSHRFERADPQMVGSNKWFGKRLNNEKKAKEYRIKKQINLWKMSELELAEGLLNEHPMSAEERLAVAIEAAKTA
jgi:hypothetical protein